MAACTCKHAWLTAPHIKTKAPLGNCRWLTRHRRLSLFVFYLHPPSVSSAPPLSLWKCVTLWLDPLPPSTSDISPPLWGPACISRVRRPAAARRCVPCWGTALRNSGGWQKSWSSSIDRWLSLWQRRENRNREVKQLEMKRIHESEVRRVHTSASKAQQRPFNSIKPDLISNPTPLNLDVSVIFCYHTEAEKWRLSIKTIVLTHKLQPPKYAIKIQPVFLWENVWKHALFHNFIKVRNKFLDPSFYPDPHQNLMGSVLGRDSSFVPVWWKYVQ